MNHRIRWQDYEQWIGKDLLKRLPEGDPPDPRLIKTDSRQIQRGDWFLALRGETYDGHCFIQNSLDRGALGFIYQSGLAPTNLSDEALKLGLETADSLHALQRIARGWRHHLQKVQVLAIGGSSGKTTAKEMLACLLRAHYQTVSPSGSMNNEIGVPLTLLQISEETRYAVLEFGARHVGDLGFLCRLAEPDVVCLLNIGNAHVGEFGGPENLKNAKLEILLDAPSSAIRVYSADDLAIRDGVVGLRGAKVRFGFDPAAEVRIVEQRQIGQTTQVHLTIDGNPQQLTIPFVHEHCAANVAAAVAVAYAAGVPVDYLQTGLTHFQAPKGRYERFVAHGAVVIDDSYNANPKSMLAGLTSLASEFGGGDIALFLGDMKELGQASQLEHLAIGQACQKMLPHSELFTIGTEARWIAQGALDSGFDAKRIKMFDSVESLLPAASRMLREGLVAYVKGSRAVALDKIIDEWKK